MSPVKNNVGRGLNIALVNGSTGTMLRHSSFDMYSGDPQPLVKFLKEIPAGALVLVASYDDPGTKMNDELRKLFSDLGSSYAKQLGFRDSWVFLGAQDIKNKSPFEQGSPACTPSQSNSETWGTGRAYPLSAGRMFPLCSAPRTGVPKEQPRHEQVRGLAGAAGARGLRAQEDPLGVLRPFLGLGPGGSCRPSGKGLGVAVVVAHLPLFGDCEVLRGGDEPQRVCCPSVGSTAVPSTPAADCQCQRRPANARAK
ncbi:protein FAM3D isoform X2 [Dasypus novemcinctus]|nr:protein FAM3D isoform X2 [Dasypus novemcinctus]